MRFSSALLTLLMKVLASKTRRIAVGTAGKKAQGKKIVESEVRCHFSLSAAFDF
jgi:hypothetical protein